MITAGAFFYCEAAVADQPLDQAKPRIEYIALEKLSPNPYQPRKSMDEAALLPLAANIRRQGLLQPIKARPHQDGFQIVFGHRRVAAYQLLDQMFGAIDGDKYKKIRAEVAEVDDDGMRSESIAENVQREEISLVDIADSLDQLASQGAPLSIEELAEKTGVSAERLKRLRRIRGAPQFIRDACSKGLVLNIETTDQGDPASGEEIRQYRRTLELYPAIEVLQIYEYYAAKATPQEAEAKTSEVIDQALKEEWGLRKLQAKRLEIQGVSKASKERTPGPKREFDSAPYRKRGDRLYIDLSRLEELTSEQAKLLLKQLRSILERIESKVGTQVTAGGRAMARLLLSKDSRAWATKVGTQWRQAIAQAILPPEQAKPSKTTIRRPRKRKST